MLLIGIDGCRSDALQQASTPHLDALLSNSVYSFDSWHVGITFSGPSWTTILTGVQWNKHGVSDNTISGSRFDSFPPFPKLAKEIKPALKCVEVVEWSPLADEFYNDGWDEKIKVADGNSFATADSAVVQLQDTALDLLFVYFDKVDLTGHTTTFSPSNTLYINAIQQVDSAVGNVLNALYARSAYANEDWLILLITDHGGNLFFHGGNTYEERHIWWIASGSAVTPEQISAPDPGTYNCNLNNTLDTGCVNLNLLKQSPIHPDIAVTALHHLIFDTGIHPETKAEWQLDGKSWLTLPSAIDERSESGIRIFPNPASDFLSIAGNRPITNMKISDLHGRTVTCLNLLQPQATLDISELAAGSYLVRACAGTDCFTKKVMVVK